jgi:23S rRNA (cytidine1920-2'-O)/16S rRNA (cytidine1409-2'-O)-methyltransferase
MNKTRLDKLLVDKGLAKTRSQSEDLVKRGFVSVNQIVVTKPGIFLDNNTQLDVKPHESFVSRAGEKLNSVIDLLKLDFTGKLVLDVGSSTGGFSELSLRRGAKRVIAVELGTNQMHPRIREDSRIELHEKTDIRDFTTDQQIDIVVIDVSFVSLREILPAVGSLSKPVTNIIAMVKPQFEAATSGLKHKGVIKNDHMRREILKDFENWCRVNFVIDAKADSKVAGAKGNVERFYVLHKKVINYPTR